MKVCCGCRWRNSFGCRKGLSCSHCLCREANRYLNVFVDKRSVSESYKVHICVRWDRMLNFKQPMKKLRPTLHILGVINACLTGTTSESCTLRIATQALVFSAALIRVTVWSRTHTSRLMLRADHTQKKKKRQIQFCLHCIP